MKVLLIIIGELTKNKRLATIGSLDELLEKKKALLRAISRDGMPTSLYGKECNTLVNLIGPRNVLLHIPVFPVFHYLPS